MGLFAKPQSINVSSPAQTNMNEEKKDTAKAKGRLLETQGGVNGQELNANQGRSIRKVFG